MKAYELIKASESLLTKFDEANINISDKRYIPLYEDYSRLKNEGHKKTYIIACMSDVYKLSEMTVYNIVNKFEKEI